MTFGDFLLSIPMWFLNGLLVTVYWLADHLAEAVSLLSSFVIAFGIDPVIQARASERPRRYERGGVQTSSQAATYFTLAVVSVWLIASIFSRFPIPLIGAAMWVIGLAAILAVSEERFNLLWWVKTGILTYAILSFLLRFGLQALEITSPAAWASVVGSSADAQVVLEQTRGNVAMIGMLFVFVLYPVGFAAMLFNRFLRNPKPLYNFWMEAGDVLRRLRTRM
ncbi:MAG: hypothetical protein JNM55_21165 [Anaerolineales bacterium]|nr:hypothetical protein [Anaerolineales bacterium]